MEGSFQVMSKVPKQTFVLFFLKKKIWDVQLSYKKITMNINARKYFIRRTYTIHPPPRLQVPDQGKYMRETWRKYENFDIRTCAVDMVIWSECLYLAGVIRYSLSFRYIQFFLFFLFSFSVSVSVYLFINPITLSIYLFHICIHFF